MTWSRARKVVQTLSLVTFLALTVAAVGQGADWVPGTIYSRLDPLVGLSSLIASRTFIAFWVASGLTLALTVVFGRAWCGWLCPLGTLVDLVPARHRKGPKRLPRGWQLGKYVVLVIVLGAAAFGSLGPMILDPITIITRPLQELARPLFGTDAASKNVGVGIGGWQVIPQVALWSLIPLVLVLALNAVDRRFWCRSACPLGGLLALVSLSPGIRRAVDTEKCTSCTRCAKVCPTDAISAEKGWTSSATECVTCMSCVDACSTSAGRFPLALAPEFIPPYVPERREALVAMGATGMGLAAAMLPQSGHQEAIDRPPSTNEERLAERCVRCGACYATCPTGILRPSMSFTSVAGPWTPMLDDRPAYCTINCNRCAELCPTDALHKLEEPERTYLGVDEKARVHRGMCIAYRQNQACMLCQAACPISGAIKAVERPDFLSRDGRPGVLVPVVVAELCIGCDECAKKCPVMPTAISVRRSGERRM
jgi:polyferredoxin